MGWLAWLFVGKPLNIAVVAGLWGIGFLVVRAAGFGASRHTHWLLVAATGWLLYAFWEWLVVVRTPEADIRVDLLVVWPLLAILSAWALFRSLR